MKMIKMTNHHFQLEATNEEETKLLTDFAFTAFKEKLKGRQNIQLFSMKTGKYNKHSEGEFQMIHQITLLTY